MILQRLTTAFRKQDWFTVVIETLIVVLGVFLGIQLGNWNAARADDARAQIYLQRIATDLTEEIKIYEDRIAFWRQVSDNGMVVLDEAAGGEELQDPWEILLAYFQASQVAEFYPVNSTFEELKSAGDLGLIRDADLRSELLTYYAYPGSESLRERPRYREHVRGIIPVRLQLYIWTNCYQTDGALQTLKSCPSPVEDAEIQQVVDRLRADQQLTEELHYWISGQEVAILIVRQSVITAHRLRDELIARLGEGGGTAT